MGFVARRMGHRADFFDLLGHTAAPGNEKDRKNQLASHHRRRIIHNPTVSWMMPLMGMPSLSLKGVLNPVVRHWMIN